MKLEISWQFEDCHHLKKDSIPWSYLLFTACSYFQQTSAGKLTSLKRLLRDVWSLRCFVRFRLQKIILLAHLKNAPLWPCKLLVIVVGCVLIWSTLIKKCDCYYYHHVDVVALFLSTVHRRCKFSPSAPHKVFSRSQTHSTWLVFRSLLFSGVKDY